MTRNQPSGERPEASTTLIVLTTLLVAFAIWCTVLFLRSHSLRQDLDFQLATVEEIRRLRGELERLRPAPNAAAGTTPPTITPQLARALAGRRHDLELGIAGQSLKRSLDELMDLLEEDSTPDAIWQATVAAENALGILEGRIQAQVSDIHRRLGDLWAGLNLLIVASLLLAASNLALLRLAHARRRSLEEAHAEAVLKSSQDPLTNVWNREAILKLLRRELARAERLRSPLGVILVDIDDFQDVNVLLGQDQGDFILEQVASGLGSFVRPYDTMGRFGGDSFLIVLPVCDETATGNVADRLREAINEHEVEHSHGRLQVTISLAYAAVENLAETEADLLIHGLQQSLGDLAGGGQVVRYTLN